jgi:hypothetical protein
MDRNELCQVARATEVATSLALKAQQVALRVVVQSGGWKLLTFICCAVAAWFLFFAETSGLVIAFVVWLLAWACALAMRMGFKRRLA